MYDDVPLTFQGLFVNDVYWKLISNILLPYHYEQPEYEHAINRIQRLLRRCDSRVILNHPHMDFFEKYYWLRMKGANTLQCMVTNTDFGLDCENKPVLREKSMEIVLTKFRIEDDSLILYGFIKSVFLQFYNSEIIVCAVENDGQLTRKLKLYESAHCFYRAREKTQKFMAFRYKANLAEVKKVRFEVGIGCSWFPTHFYFMPRIPFSRKYQRFHAVFRGYEISCTPANELCFQKATPAPQRERIWLYYDCAGVACDNGYLQFSHDVHMDDGIARYYIVTDPGQTADASLEPYFVEFGSEKHKQLLTECEKIFTAYIEESNIYPYTQDELIRYAGQMDFEVIYLQHGVLHIIMPWKFSPEKIMADKVVVSTRNERQLFLDNGFEECDIIPTGMARFECMDKTQEKEKKILLALSWRSYLVGEYKDHHWEKLEGKFLASKYYTEMQRLIAHPHLTELLQKSGWQMEIRLHPIFMQYQKLFDAGNPNICFASGSMQQGEYSLLITDFSSFLYDFLYLGTDIMNFIPDADEFKCGMNGYRELNYDPSFWDSVAYTTDQLVEKIEAFLSGTRFPFPYDHFLEMGACREDLYHFSLDTHSSK